LAPSRLPAPHNGRKNTTHTQGVFYLIDKIEGYRRVFDVTDTSLAHPYTHHERIPVWLLAIICGLVPALMIIIMA
jgi:diacylglycerol diphosphate phosphatase/phosphatidate phosphatase